MVFDEFVKYIRKTGCNVLVYKDKSLVDGNSGYFNCKKNGKPFICIATKTLPQSERMEILAHEYGHFLQYLEEKDVDAEEVEIWEVFEKWTRGEEFSKKLLNECRQLMLISEWDANVRALEVAKNLTLTPWNSKSLICYTNAYLASIKWGWETRTNWDRTAARWHFRPIMPTLDEVLAPLTTQQFKKIDRWMRAENKLTKRF